MQQFAKGNHPSQLTFFLPLVTVTTQTSIITTFSDEIARKYQSSGFLINVLPFTQVPAQKVDHGRMESIMVPSDGFFLRHRSFGTIGMIPDDYRPVFVAYLTVTGLYDYLSQPCSAELPLLLQQIPLQTAEYSSRGQGPNQITLYSYSKDVLIQVVKQFIAVYMDYGCSMQKLEYGLYSVCLLDLGLFDHTKMVQSIVHHYTTLGQAQSNMSSQLNDIMSDPFNARYLFPYIVSRCPYRFTSSKNILNACSVVQEQSPRALMKQVRITLVVTRQVFQSFLSMDSSWSHINFYHPDIFHKPTPVIPRFPIPYCSKCLHRHEDLRLCSNPNGSDLCGNCSQQHTLSSYCTNPPFCISCHRAGKSSNHSIWSINCREGHRVEPHYRSQLLAQLKSLEQLQ